ncbi:transcriptional regulator GcvA [Noviherbaspirillum pedocola]|uniref:Transcriptional regulator GcvA n=1 Tax=Noviherbaspirillum pedocola TaxID=2801341 RepID=A0A934W805_9BURK|nr:transcriptional regulator GcvA [Noviherbaspirillum pedocola]MBK4735264.1 transcriptional regulator GcvA [Noviherbaspirillum pedocola]
MDKDNDPRRESERLPPLNALRNFEAVARHGSFAAAAADLHVTHWAVGKQIRLLEDWFGVPLFERRPRGVVLTDAGAALLNDVHQAFARLGAAAAGLRQERPAYRVSGIVRINVLSSFALCWLLPRLGDFYARYPDIDVRVSTSSRKLRYVGDAFDIGVRSGQEAGAGVVSRPLMPDMRLPACSPALLRRHPIRSAADLRAHTLLHSASTRSAWPQWLREAGMPHLRAARHVEFDHTYLQLAAAVEGLGVALASLPLIRRDIAAGRLMCPIAAPAWRAADYALVINADRAGDAAVLAFERWITAMADREGESNATGEHIAQKASIQPNPD